jgi:hypothetical protein
MPLLTDPNAWIGLLTLTALELVLIGTNLVAERIGQHIPKG